MNDDSDPQDIPVHITGGTDEGSARLAVLQEMDAIPIEELEALADAWESMPESCTNRDERIRYMKRGECAQELREVIEQYE